jgi:hypothetical protein
MWVTCKINEPTCGISVIGSFAVEGISREKRETEERRELRSVIAAEGREDGGILCSVLLMRSAAMKGS